MPKRERLRENIERGGRLKIARVDAGYETGEEAAEDLGIAYSTYNNHEQGWRGISHNAARRYAVFFKVNLDWLYENIGERRGEALSKPSDLLQGLPPKGQQEAIEYIEYLRTKYGV